jgi:hypothetical protein
MVMQIASLTSIKTSQRQTPPACRQRLLIGCSFLLQSMQNIIGDITDKFLAIRKISWAIRRARTVIIYQYCRPPTIVTSAYSNLYFHSFSSKYAFTNQLNLCGLSGSAKSQAVKGISDLSRAHICHALSPNNSHFPTSTSFFART